MTKEPNARRSPSPAFPNDSSSLSLIQLQERLNSQEEVEYTRWMETYNGEKHVEEISTLLSNNASIKALFTQLVPSELSEQEFWGRYFFKVERAQKKEERRLVLLDKTKQIATEMSNVDFGWDDDLEPPEVIATKSEPVAEKEDAEKETPSDHSYPHTNETQASLEVSQSPSNLLDKPKDSETVQQQEDQIISIVVSTPSTNEQPKIELTSSNEEKSAIEENPKKEENQAEDVFEWS